MGHMKWMAGAVAALVLAGCDPVPVVQDASCDNPLACDVAQIVVSELRGDVGMEFGGGVSLRNVQSVGPVVVVDLNLPLSKASFDDPRNADLPGSVAQSFAEGFCGEDDIDEFFSTGALMRVRGFSKDNALVSDATITSCDGIG